MVSPYIFALLTGLDYVHYFSLLSNPGVALHVTQGDPEYNSPHFILGHYKSLRCYGDEQQLFTSKKNQEQRVDISGTYEERGRGEFEIVKHIENTRNRGRKT